MSRQKPDWKRIYLSFDGRINRSTWWLMVWLPLMALNFVAVAVDYAVGNVGESGYGMFSLIAALVTVVPMFAAYVKRAHDRGRSGWFVLLLLVPLANLWAIVELLFLRGTVGENKFGPDSV